MKVKKITAFVLVSAAGLYFSCIHSSTSGINGNQDRSADKSTAIAGAARNSASQDSGIDVKTGYISKTEEETAAAEGEREIKALFEAYSDKISKTEIRKNEWAFLLEDEWFYWQGGRLLPESKIDDGNSYRSYGFYNYSLNYPKKLIIPDERQLERIKGFTRSRQTVSRDTTFLDSLYGGSTLSEIRSRIKNTRFLGFRFETHEKIIPLLEAVERDIREAELSDSSITEYIKSLGNIGSFNWREIEGSMSRSYHSYGIAVDLVPANVRGREIYWVWTGNYNNEWYSVPYEKRWMAPEAVVEIFESYGFIWGGKWLFFDNMHFEYRPELLILAGKEVKLPLKEN